MCLLEGGQLALDLWDLVEARIKELAAGMAAPAASAAALANREAFSWMVTELKEIRKSLGQLTGMSEDLNEVAEKVAWLQDRAKPLAARRTSKAIAMPNVKAKPANARDLPMLADALWRDGNREARFERLIGVLNRNGFVDAYYVKDVFSYRATAKALNERLLTAWLTPLPWKSGKGKSRKPWLGCVVTSKGWSRFLKLYGDRHAPLS
jgi:hypothetical protein